MTFSDNPARHQLIEQVLSARTLPEITVATNALRYWVQENPADVGIIDGFEALSMMRDIAEEQAIEAGLADSQAGRAVNVTQVRARFGLPR